jgi:hypothetical protein
MLTHRLVTVDGRVTDPWPADEAALRPDSAGESADLFCGELAVGVEDDSSGRVLTLARPNPEGPPGRRGCTPSGSADDVRSRYAAAWRFNQRGYALPGATLRESDPEWGSGCRYVTDHEAFSAGKRREGTDSRAVRARGSDAVRER